MAEKTGKALLVVDVQNDFCPDGALPVKNGDRIIEPLNKMMNYARKNRWPIFSSRDWHPPESKHFKPLGDWPIHCVQDSYGAQFHPNLKISGTDYIVSKGTDPNENGYSPFEGKAYFRPLDELLRYFKIKEIYIGGLATDYCVKAAVLDARRLGYKTYVLTDACRAVNLKPGDEVRALSEMANAGAQFITTSEVILQSR